jgi:hypothetical protein
MYNFASGPHGNALLRIGENLANHLLIEPAPSKLAAHVRRQHKVQDGNGLAIHHSNCGIASRDFRRGWDYGLCPSASHAVARIAPPASAAERVPNRMKMTPTSQSPGRRGRDGRGEAEGDAGREQVIGAR